MSLFKLWKEAYHFPTIFDYEALCDQTCIVASQLLHHFFKTARGFSVEEVGYLNQDIRIRLTRYHKRATIRGRHIFEYHIKHHNASLNHPPSTLPGNISGFHALVLVIASPPRVRGLWKTGANSLHEYAQRVMLANGVRQGPVLMINNDTIEAYQFRAGSAGLTTSLDACSFATGADATAQLAPDHLDRVEVLMRGFAQQVTRYVGSREFSNLSGMRPEAFKVPRLDRRRLHPERTWKLAVRCGRLEGEAVLERPPVSPISAAGDDEVEEREVEERHRKKSRKV